MDLKRGNFFPFFYETSTRFSRQVRKKIGNVQLQVKDINGSLDPGVDVQGHRIDKVMRSFGQNNIKHSIMVRHATGGASMNW